MPSHLYFPAFLGQSLQSKQITVHVQRATASSPSPALLALYQNASIVTSRTGNFLVFLCLYRPPAECPKICYLCRYSLCIHWAFGVLTLYGIPPTRAILFGRGFRTLSSVDVRSGDARALLAVLKALEGTLSLLYL